MPYIESSTVPQTSLAVRGGPPVTVEFFKWTAFGNTAYQKGQRAGFTEQQAALIVRRGAGRIVGRIDQGA